MTGKKDILTLSMLLFFWTATAFGQTFSPEEQGQLDSLNAIINNPASHDTSLSGAYVGLSEILYVSNLDTMIPICSKAKAIAEKALTAHPPIPVVRSLKVALAASLNNIGYIHNMQGDIPLALEYYHKSLKIREEISDKRGMADSYINIGFILENQGDIPLALEYLHKSLKIYEEISDKQGMAYSYNNIGVIYNNQGDISLALEYYHKSLKIREEISDKQGMAYSYNNIGFIHKNQGDIPLALEYYHQSLKIMEEISDKQGMATSLSNIGNLLLKEGKNLGMSQSSSLTAARKNGERGLQMARDLGFPDLIERNAGLLYKVAQKEGKWQEALEMRNLQIQMRDSIMAEENAKAALKQQMQYEYEKQKAIDQAEHDAELKRQKAVADEQEKKQNIIIGSISGGLGLVVLFSIFLFNRFRVTRKQRDTINKQKGEVEHQKELVEEKNKEILDSIQYAKRIQEAILPSMVAMEEALKDGFVLYKPKDVVAGDFYWLEKHDNKIYFAAADCTGHGVPGAMVSVICSNALSKALLEEKAASTGELLDKTRDIVINRLAKSGEEVKDGMDISLCAVDFSTGQLQWSGANNPLWIIRDGELIEYKHDKQAIGIQDNAKPFTTHAIELQKNDMLYIFTDGYQDQFGGEKGKKFKSANFQKLLLSIQYEPMDRQRKLISEAFDSWKRDLEQVDDVCVIGVRI